MLGVTRAIDVYQKSTWADRFIIAAIIQGALTAALTSYLLYEGVWGSPAASRIVANLGGAGNAGIWLTVGFLVYVIMGPIAVAVTALFYRHIEGRLHKPYRGVSKLLAWTALPTSQGGLGWTTLQIHANIMSAYPTYIAVFIAIALVGAIAGGLGYVIAWHKSISLP